MDRRHIRVALFAGVPHWVIGRSLPQWLFDPKSVAARAFGKVYGR